MSTRHAFTPLWPDVEPLVRAKQPHHQLPRANGEGWIGPLHSPLREDTNPSFSVKPDSETQPGAWKDHATGEHGSMADLARQLGVQQPTPRGTSPTLMLEAFCEQRHLDAEWLRRVCHVREQTLRGRPALRYSTGRGDRLKYLDGRKPKYGWVAQGGGMHWYLLGAATKKTGDVLYLVNGEPATWAAIQGGVPATCLCAGEGTLPTLALVEELRKSRFKTFAVVYDLDAAGRRGGVAVAAALRAAGLDARALELPASLGEGGDVDDLHRIRGAELGAALVTLPELIAPQEARGEQQREDRPPDESIDILSDPEPWPDPVDGAAVLNEVVATLTRFVALSLGEIEAIALWIVHAHAIDAAAVSPILAVLSPQKRCGKSTLHAVIRYLVPRPLPTSNISPAALFRAVEEFQPTLLVDEIDSFIRNNDDLRGILNSGHLRTSASVIRCEGDAHKVKTFTTWAAKTLACIGRLPETLEDRSITVLMRRALKGEVAERLRLDRLGTFEPIRRRLARWASDHLEALRQADPAIPGELFSDRACDNWRPLLAIADEAEGEWPERARKAARLLAGATEADESAAVKLLGDIRDLFDQRGVPRLASGEIIKSLVAMEERSWPEWRDGRAITAPGVSRLLKPFGIRPKQWRETTDVIRGYLKENFAEAWARYLPPSPPMDSVHSVQDSKQTTSETTNSVHCTESVPSTTSSKSNVLNDVPTVPSATPTQRHREREPGDDDEELPLVTLPKTQARRNGGLDL